MDIVKWDHLVYVCVRACVHVCVRVCVYIHIYLIQHITEHNCQVRTDTQQHQLSFCHQRICHFLGTWHETWLMTSCRWHHKHWPLYRCGLIKETHNHHLCLTFWTSVHLIKMWQFLRTSKCLFTKESKFTFKQVVYYEKHQGAMYTNFSHYCYR